MLNGKYKCVKAVTTDWITLGNIYEFVNGVFVLNNGCKSMCYKSVEDFNRINPCFMIEKVLSQPHKDLLRSGDKVVRRNKEEKWVITEIERFFDIHGVYAKFSYYNDDLTYNDYSRTYNDIMEIWRGDKLIAKRVEKSEREIEIDRIESEMRKLADDLRKVKGE